MLFRGIEICNFGRYAGTNFFDTTVTGDRNVILVKANNDRGKTTLFQAIKFAMYGEEGIRPKSASDWINLQNASEGDGEMHVEIKFDHERDVYRLKRLVKFRKTERGKEITTVGNPAVELFKNDNPHMTGDSDSNKKDWIDTILPKDASQFFFFDGEEIQKYIQHEESHVKQAIEKVLGIKELLNAKEDMMKILGRFQTEYDKNIRKHAKDERSRNDLERIEGELEDVNESIKAEQTSQKGAYAYKNKLDKEQKKYESIKATVDTRDATERELENQKKLLHANKKDLTAARGNTSIILLSPLLEIIHRTEDDPPSVDRWQSDTIRYILNNLDQCVCDRPIDQNMQDVFHTKILDIKPSKTSIIKQSANNMLIEHEPAAKWVRLQESLRKEADIMQEIDKQKSTLKDLNRQIRGIEGTQAIKELQKKYEEVVKDIGVSEKKLEQHKTAKLKLENQKKNIDAHINASVVDAQLTLAKRKMDTCQTVMNCIDQSIEKFYETRKPDLEAHISKIFSSLTNNPDMYRGLKIDRNFNMRVVRNDGTELPTFRYSPSAGASQIVATSMIGGLNKFATRDAPVVIDTPLGRLDPEHRKNLISYYSKMSKQIIILYQPSELEDEDIQNINDSIASEWELDSQPDRPDLSRMYRVRSHI